MILGVRVILTLSPKPRAAVAFDPATDDELRTCGGVCENQGIGFL